MTVATEAFTGLAVWTGQPTIGAGFSAENATDIHVTATAGGGEVTNLVQGTQYTVTIGANGAVTLNIIAAAMPPQPQLLTMWRDTPALQGVDFQDLQDFSADDHEMLHDRWARLFAEIRGGLARALRVPMGEIVQVLPPATERAGKGLAFDSTGQPVLAESTGGVIGATDLFVFLDDANGLITKAITADDLPLANNAAIGAVRAKPFEEHKWLQFLAQDGFFSLAQPAVSDLVPGMFEENLPMSAGRVYNIMRAPGDPSDGLLRAIWVGNSVDPAIYFQKDVIHFRSSNGSVEYGFMSSPSGMQGFTLDGLLNTFKNLTTAMFAPNQVRERLTANRNLFVNTTTGSDTNNGLQSTVGTAPAGPVKTINKAIQIAAGYDGLGFLVAINVAAGTYAESVIMLSHVVNQINVTSTTPRGAIIQPAAGGGCIAGNSVRGLYQFNGFKTISPSDFIQVSAQRGTQLNLVNHEFGAAPGFGVHVQSGSQASIQISGGYEISGGAFVHWNAITNASITAAGQTVTLTGTPAFTGRFAQASQSAVIACGTNTFVGLATGASADSATNAAIDTAKGGGILSSPATMTSGNPDITWNANGLSANDAVTFTVSPAPNVVVGQMYYVLPAGLTTTAFRISLTVGGALITPNGTGAATVTVNRAANYLPGSHVYVESSGGVVA